MFALVSWVGNETVLFGGEILGMQKGRRGGGVVWICVLFIV